MRFVNELLFEQNISKDINWNTLLDIYTKQLY